jgi:heterodisulfide reductase subunit A
MADPTDIPLRIGVFVCHCGSNIAAVVDVEQVAKYAETLPNVVLVLRNLYMCSDPGQNEIKKAIKEHHLDRVVVASCTPRIHEGTFRACVADAGLNPYLLEMANLREHCSWVHPGNNAKATEKAKTLIRSAVARAARLKPQAELELPVKQAALVIGGGIAGLSAALDIAKAGHKVYLVEKEPSVGGMMAQLYKTYPTMDCST